MTPGWFLIYALAAVFALLIFFEMYRPVRKDDPGLPTAPEVIDHPSTQPQSLQQRSEKPRSALRLRLAGATILLFNFWLIGEYKIQGIPVLLMTAGFAGYFEFFVVRPATKPPLSS